jgi:hypothetical protein
MSGSTNIHTTTVIGAAADLTVGLPFTPKFVDIFVVTGGAIEHGKKTDSMAGSSYLSTTTGLDAGVTIGDKELTIANGADVNVAAATIYIVCYS